MERRTLVSDWIQAEWSITEAIEDLEGLVDCEHIIEAIKLLNAAKDKIADHFEK